MFYRDLAVPDRSTPGLAGTAMAGINAPAPDDVVAKFGELLHFPLSHQGLHQVLTREQKRKLTMNEERGNAGALYCSFFFLPSSK